MPTVSGPQTYQSRTTDSYKTYNPQNAGNLVRVEVVVPVTVPWNHKRTDLIKDKKIEFGTPLWLRAGAGPHEVFKLRPGQLYEPIGSITWSITTEVLVKTQTSSNSEKRRFLITPFIHLMRTFKPLRGGTPTTEKVKGFGDTLRGNWHAIPEEELV